MYVGSDFPSGASFVFKIKSFARDDSNVMGKPKNKFKQTIVGRTKHDGFMQISCFLAKWSMLSVYRQDDSTLSNIDLTQALLRIHSARIKGQNRKWSW